MNLFFRTYGEGKPLVILHGLFGMSDNWIDIAKSFSDSFQVYLPDIRNHGRSFHHPVHDYPSLATDIFRFIDNLGISKSYFIGHSMGGKSLLYFAEHYPDYIEKMIVVDISPREYSNDRRSGMASSKHHQIIEILQKIEEYQFSDRKNLNLFIDQQIDDFFTKQVILKNIEKNSDSVYHSRLNLNAIVNAFDKLGEEILIGENLRFMNVMFLFGDQSDYFEKSDELLISQKMPYAILQKVNGAGHNVHVDNKTDFVNYAKAFFLN